MLAALPAEISEILPEVEVTFEPASQSPQPFAFARFADDPDIEIAPVPEEMTSVPVVAVPPWPSNTPMWFPVPVTPVARMPSSVIVPEVVLMNEDFKVSMPELCEVVPIEAESWPRSKTLPAPAVIVPTRRMPE